MATTTCTRGCKCDFQITDSSANFWMPNCKKNWNKDETTYRRHDYQHLHLFPFYRRERERLENYSLSQLAPDVAEDFNDMIWQALSHYPTSVLGENSKNWNICGKLKTVLRGFRVQRVDSKFSFSRFSSNFRINRIEVNLYWAKVGMSLPFTFYQHSFPDSIHKGK